MLILYSGVGYSKPSLRGRVFIIQEINDKSNTSYKDMNKTILYHKYDININKCCII